MEEQLISFETAKLAKEKEFPQSRKAKGKFRDDGSIENLGIGGAMLDTCKEWYERPTQSLLAKWLREEHEKYVHVEVWRNMDHCNEYTGIITKPAYIKPLYDKTNRGLDIMESKAVSFKHTYEEALENALIEALKLIK